MCMVVEREKERERERERESETLRFTVKIFWVSNSCNSVSPPTLMFFGADFSNKKSPKRVNIYIF